MRMEHLGFGNGGEFIIARDARERKPTGNETGNVGQMSKWQNRIVGNADVPPAQLIAHDRNWRTHPAAQSDALLQTIGGLGFIRSVTVNRRTGRILDGHLRVRLAIDSGQETIPVEYVDLSEAEELEALATIDPLGALAASDAAQIDALLASVGSLPPPVDSLLRIASESAQVAALLATTSEGGESGDRLSTDPATVVTCVLPCPDVAIVERALAATGLLNRGEAFKAVCAAYLDAREGKP
jgi:hypothetical protein